MALPDLLGAFLVQTATKSATYNLCNGRVSAGRVRTQNPDDPSGWVMPTRAVVYLMVPGPSMPRRGRIPFRSQNVQVECYGTDLRTANEMYRTWYSDFYPSDLAMPQGFIAAQCSVYSIEELSSPVALYGGENIWPKVVSTHFVKYLEIPASTVVRVTGSAALGAAASTT